MIPKMKITFLSLFAVIFAGSAFSQTNQTTSRTVKIESVHSGAKDMQFQGSGTLFSYADSYYVLTSEHIVIYTKKNIEVNIMTPNQERFSATLLRADYGTGLALLKLNAGQRPAHTLTFDQVFRSAPVNANEHVTLEGFHTGTTTLERDPRGQVINAESDRHDIPLVTSMIELQGAYVEYGLSGSGAWDTNGKLVGVTSHQVVRIIPGHASQIASMQPNQKVVDNHALLIPAVYAQKWTQDALKNANACIFAAREPRQQLRHEEVILLDHSIWSRGKSSSSPVGGGDGHGVGGDGHGIGGGDGHGVGGGDTHGVGGDDQDQSTMSSHEILVTPVPLNQTEWTLCKNEIRLLETPVTFHSLIKIQNGAVTETPVHSIAEALSRILNSREAPLVDSGAPVTTNLTWKRFNDQLVAITLDQKKSEKPYPVYAAALLQDLQTIAKIMAGQSGTELLISNHIVKDVLARSQAWNELWAIQFEKGTELYSILDSLR